MKATPSMAILVGLTCGAFVGWNGWVIAIFVWAAISALIAQQVTVTR